MRRFLLVGATVIALVGGGSLVAMARENLGPTPSAAKVQYREKPGCGPEGQPPRIDDDRDCPASVGQR